MTNSNFKMTKREENAADFGVKYFPNGYSRQIVYSLFQDGKMIKQLISTNFKDNMFAHIIIGAKAINGIAIVPMQEIIYEIRFSKNSNKNFGLGTRVIKIQAE